MINDAADFHLPDRPIGLVFFHQTFHHIANQESDAAEFFRVLKPGGVLLFAESCSRLIDSWMIRLLFSHPMNVQETAIEHLRLLQDAGFRIRAGMVLKPFLRWSRPNLGLFDALSRRIPENRDISLLYLAADKPR